MDDHVLNHLRGLYGADPDVPHVAFQFPRLPPGPRREFDPGAGPALEGMLKDAGGIGGGLQGFQHAYQMRAAGLLTAGPMVVPPGHPLYTLRDSVSSLRAENDKLLKENAELRKRLEDSRSHSTSARAP